MTSFWFWPLVSILFAVWLAWLVAGMGSYLSASAYSPLLESRVESYAAVILTTTAAADVTILTFVFSTLMVVLQLASSQLSPRIIRTIVRDGAAQVVMAIMVGGFVFSLMALMNSFVASDPIVPATLVVISLAWTIVIVLTFLRFVSYTISRIRAPAVIRSIADTTTHSIRHAYTTPPPSAGAIDADYPVTTAVRAPRDGVLTGLRMREMVTWAQRRDASITLEVGLGDYLSKGVRIGHVRSQRPVGEYAISGFMMIRRERTLRGDPPYGFRLLVDIANRALSPAINDPTTACQVLDELESLLVLLAGRHEEPGRLHDEAGVLRVEAPVIGWRDYLRLAVQEIYEYGSESSQVTQRIARMLDELADVVDGDRLRAVEQLRQQIAVIPPLVPGGVTAGAVMTSPGGVD